MAAKEKKSAVAKHLKDSQVEREKLPETPKSKRGRKSNASNDNKISPEQKTPLGRKRRKDNAQDGRSTPVLKRARRSAVEQEEAVIVKTPPPAGPKMKKAHLEKELGDLLESATGRNTPLLPRNKKIYEKEDESADSVDEKAGLYLTKLRKTNERDADDDNISVKSFSTLLRTRKNAEKEVDDDLMSVRSLSLKTRKTDPNDDDSSSVRSLLRPNSVGKPGRKKKCVLAAIAVKKKIFIRRGRPKKIKDVNDAKGKQFEDKKVGRIKMVDKGAPETKQKRIIKKPLKFQNKVKDQTRLRSSLGMKNQKLKKTKLKLADKHKQRKGEAEIPKSDDMESIARDRLKADGQTMALTDGLLDVDSDAPLTRNKMGIRKRKVRSDGRTEDSDVDNSEKSNEVYYYSEVEGATSQDSTGRSRGGKVIRHARKTKLSAKKHPEGKKRRESGIHFETTRSPDDSSVMIVHPRLGPRIKGAKRLKPLLPKGDAMNKHAKNAAVTQDGVSIALIPSQSGFNQQSNPYFVQSIPNFNLFAANSNLMKSYAKSSVNSNFESGLPVGVREFPFAEDGDFAVASFGSKVSSNDIIVTPSGIVLSGNRVVQSGNQNLPLTCFNGSESNFSSEASNGDHAFSSSKESSAGSSLPHHHLARVNQPQSCPSNSAKTIFIKNPETVSTSLIGATAGSVLTSSNVSLNGTLRINNVKSNSICNSSAATIASEKASEGDCQTSRETTASGSFKTVSILDVIPSIPVAKNVNDLLLLKSKSAIENSQKERNAVRVRGSLGKPPCDMPNLLKERNSLRDEGKSKIRLEKKPRRRTLKNVRHFHGSSNELTFSEPESSSSFENEDGKMHKTISCERIEKSTRIFEPSPKFLLQLGSEPMTISESLAPYETASVLLVSKKEKLEERLEKEGFNVLESPKVKEAVDVCQFSKENEEALKELGLDSDFEQTKSEVEGDSPVKSKKLVAGDELINDEEASEPALMQEKVNVLKVKPFRKVSNFNFPTNRLFVKQLLMLQDKGYDVGEIDCLRISPSKPPTVIDKLLEKNKSLKKAEEEGKYESVMRNLSENSVSYEVVDAKPRKTVRELRARKFVKGMETRRTVHKKYVHETSNKIYERRGSNPEMYSSTYLTVKSEVPNENVPLRRVTDPGDGKYYRRGSMDYDSIHKVLDRRCSLPTSSGEPAEVSKSPNDVNKPKTENIKTIVVDTSKPFASKSRTSDVKPRVINIVTSNCGLKKGKNLMEEIGLDIGAEPKAYVNGDNPPRGRRPSVESSNSETDSLQKLLDGLPDVNADDKSSDGVPYYDDKSSLRKDNKLRLSLDEKIISDGGKEKKNVVIEESPEDLVTKETILSALGLQSLKAAAESAQKKKENQNHGSVCQTENGGYTGTLKTVIKIHRQEKKGSSKNPIKMVYKASSSSSSISGLLDDSNQFDDGEVTLKEDAEESTSEDNKNNNGKAKSLVIPEKASSFSIHPGRMCSDVCTYCFGKFGLLDTPCHVAQLKDADKRRNILATEVHLTADSCLCDACFRHVDKKSNCPTFTEKKNDIRRRAVRKQTCIAQNCNAESQHSIRRRLFVKLKKSIGRKVVLDGGKLEKLQPGQSLTFCNRHIYWIDYFMSCGICKKRLTTVNMYRVSHEIAELNSALSSDEIPAILTENRFLCKICNCYASLRLKYRDPDELSSSHRQFYDTCRRRILKNHGMEVPDSEAEGETKNSSEGKNLRRTKRISKPTATVTNENSKSDNDMDGPLEDISKAIESEKGEKGLKKVSHMNIPPKANGNLDFGGVSITPATTEVNPTQIHVKLGNLNIGALGNLNIGQDVRHGARPGEIQCFPTETELALRAHFDLKPPSAEDESAKTARKGFEKCTTTIQFSPETKNLFYNLQMPYGNQSSFFRHLILLEKYFRSGDLVISKNADPKAVNYISSVQNRIRSYEGVYNPSKKTQEILPSLSILPQPIKTETRTSQDVKPGVMPSRPFTLTPMPCNSTYYLKNSPLSQIQATVQNIQPIVPKQGQGIMTSLLKSSLQSASKYANHPKPEVSITSVSADSNSPVRVGSLGSGKATVLTSKIQENLRNLASKSQIKQPNQARAVILNRTVEGQKQSLVQVTTGGKTIHLTLSQFRRIQQMQMKKKQYMEHQAKLMRGKEEGGSSSGSGTVSAAAVPLISEVRSLAGEDIGWEGKSDSNEGSSAEPFPKIPKALSVSVTKVPPPEYTAKEQSVEPVD